MLQCIILKKAILTFKNFSIKIRVITPIRLTGQNRVILPEALFLCGLATYINNSISGLINSFIRLIR